MRSTRNKAPSTYEFVFVCSLRGRDLAVALQLTLTRGASTAEVSSSLCIPLAEAQSSLLRLTKSRLIHRATHELDRDALLRFLVGGVPIVFPASSGAPTKGIATAFCDGAQSVSHQPVVLHQQCVWPNLTGRDVGAAITPLYGTAWRTVKCNPPLYGLLALVDMLRLGREDLYSLARTQIAAQFEAAMWVTPANHPEPNIYAYPGK